MRAYCDMRDDRRLNALEIALDARHDDCVQLLLPFTTDDGTMARGEAAPAAVLPFFVTSAHPSLVALARGADDGPLVRACAALARSRLGPARGLAATADGRAALAATGAFQGDVGDGARWFLAKFAEFERVLALRVAKEAWSAARRAERLALMGPPAPTAAARALFRDGRRVAELARRGSCVVDGALDAGLAAELRAVFAAGLASGDFFGAPSADSCNAGSRSTTLALSQNSSG